MALKIVPLFPAPNRAPDDVSGSNNFRANDVLVYTRDNGLVKVDHSLSNNNKLTGRYIYNADVNGYRSVFPEPAADTTARFRRAWTRAGPPSWA